MVFVLVEVKLLPNEILSLALYSFLNRLKCGLVVFVMFMFLLSMGV